MAKRKRGAPPPVDAPVAKKRTPDVPQEKTLQDQAARDRMYASYARNFQDLTDLDHSTELNAVNPPLLRLPAELRIAIYTYALEDSGNRFKDIDRWTLDLISHTTLRSGGHGLLLASRQLHAETALLPYQLGWFYFDLPSLTRKQCYPLVSEFLERRSKEQIKAMKCLTVSHCPFSVRGITSGTGSYWVETLTRSKTEQRT
jgi:hypothetical protein